MSYPIVLIAKRRPLKDQLVETWTVAAWEQTNNDGSKLHRFGTNPIDVNMYNADGSVFVMFANLSTQSPLPDLGGAFCNYQLPDSGGKNVTGFRSGIGRCFQRRATVLIAESPSGTTTEMPSRPRPNGTSQAPLRGSRLSTWTLPFD